MKSNNALIVILGTVTLDAVGIGLVMPVLPGLLRDIVHSDSIASHYGVLLALYALMQFLCAPVLGALSDRFGRRPVLLASLLGATIDYAIMATTPVLWILFVRCWVEGEAGRGRSGGRLFSLAPLLRPPWLRRLGCRRGFRSLGLRCGHIGGLGLDVPPGVRAERLVGELDLPRFPHVLPNGDERIAGR